MYRTDFWTLWEKVRVGCSERIALKQVYYQRWNRSPAQVGCMRQVLRAGALGRPRGMGWGGRREGGSGWGTHVDPWLIHVNVWQKSLQYCKVIRLQLKKKKKKLEKKKDLEVHKCKSQNLLDSKDTLWVLTVGSNNNLTSEVKSLVWVKKLDFIIIHCDTQIVKNKN